MDVLHEEPAARLKVCLPQQSCFQSESAGGQGRQAGAAHTASLRLSEGNL